jgi:hypothetical protein
VRNLAVIAFAMSDPGSINSIVFGLETKEILPTQNTIFRSSGVLFELGKQMGKIAE